MASPRRRSLSLSTLDRIFLKAGSVPADIAASEALDQVLEQAAQEILRIAGELSKHARRKTINDADVHLAFDQWHKKAG